MKILLSAYACEPNRGSEPGVGWNWAIELAKLGHQVHVITRANNEQVISTALKEIPRDNLHFIYYDVPKWLTWWKKGGRGVHLYYFLWQIGIYSVVKKLLKKVSFDVIHHVTFVSVRQPSFLGLLGIPFIFGPAAGGERAPMRLRKSFPLRGKLTDGLRDLANAWVKFSPLMGITFRTAKTIYATSEETLCLIPKRFHKKTFIKLAIGSDAILPGVVKHAKYEGPPRVLYVGQLLYWKGVHLALRSFAALLKRAPESRLTILGKGPDKMWLKSLSAELGVDRAVEWLEWLPRCEVDGVYQKHHLLLFPSLHDSGGMVVLEAMSNSLPVVCLDLGGARVTVDDSCGYKIKTKERTEGEVVGDLGKVLIELFLSPENLTVLTKGALKRSSTMSWSSLVGTVYNEVTDLSGL